MSAARFRCTACGACCRVVRVPLTHVDLGRLVAHTGERPEALVDWLRSDEVDMEGEPETFVDLPHGRRLMVLKHDDSGCRFLAVDGRCTVYSARPTSCRTFPLVADVAEPPRLALLDGVGKPGAARVDCDYAEDGAPSVDEVIALRRAEQAELADYARRVQAFNRRQRARRRIGRARLAARVFLEASLG